MLMDRPRTLCYKGFSILICFFDQVYGIVKGDSRNRTLKTKYSKGFKSPPLQLK